MRYGGMISDLAQALVTRPVTRLYPVEPSYPPTRLRGLLRWDPEGCIGCELCAKDCPSGALELIVINKDEKEFQMRYWVDRCAFCGQCVTSCRQTCLHFASDTWELAAMEKSSFVVVYGEKPDGGSPVEGSPQGGN
jgi:formate hydrogenlyase subunit 6/NADH:ubiquinone oxidoreductase subunit I